MTAPVRARSRRPLLSDLVRDGLRSAIAAGEFPAGSWLPNESQLCERFAVSRVTVREAVRVLVEEGYVVRVHGVGTRVAPRPPLRHSLDLNFSYMQLIAASGRVPGARCLSARRVAATRHVAERLGLLAGTRVVRLERVRTADGEPVIVSIDYMAEPIMAGPPARAALQRSMYELLGTLGHPVHHGEAALAPAVADAWTSRILGCEPGTLLQRIDQVDFDAEGNRVMYSQEWHLPRAVELRVFRRGPGTLRPDAVELSGPER
jgi:GntR family transcriptional regulator